MLKIGVLVKSVLDTEAKLISENGALKIVSGKIVCNPFDEFAIEESIRIKEKLGANVTAVSLNSTGREDELRYAMAMGADNSVLIKTDRDIVSPLKRAKVIYDVIKGEKFDLIISGREAIDDNFSATSQILANLLGYNVISEVIEERVEGDKIIAKRVLEESEETYELNLPAIITVRKGINNPRYPTLPNVMKSKKMPLKKIEVNVKGDDLSIYYEDKPQKSGAKILNGTYEKIADQLIAIMKNEFHVI
jgi:Electron transfer flavoprotein, beta subunit